MVRFLFSYLPSLLLFMCDWRWGGVLICWFRKGPFISVSVSLTESCDPTGSYVATANHVQDLLTRSVSVMCLFFGTSRMTMLLHLAFSTSVNPMLSIFWLRREISVAKCLTWSLRNSTLVCRESTLAFVFTLSSMSSNIFSYLERKSWHISSMSASFWTACMTSDSQEAQNPMELGRFVRNVYSSFSSSAQLWQIQCVRSLIPCSFFVLTRRSDGWHCFIDTSQTCCCSQWWCEEFMVQSYNKSFTREINNPMHVLMLVQVMHKKAVWGEVCGNEIQVKMSTPSMINVQHCAMWYK